MNLNGVREARLALYEFESCSKQTPGSTTTTGSITVVTPSPAHDVGPDQTSSIREYDRNADDLIPTTSSSVLSSNTGSDGASTMSKRQTFIGFRRKMKPKPDNCYSNSLRMGT